MKRNSAIDYLKFLFSIVIFLYHYDLIFCGGYIVVEGFFMISGYLMFCSLKKRGEQDDLPDSTARFVWHKYQALFLPLFFSALSGLLIYDLLVYPSTLKDTLWGIPLLTFEIFPLQCAGFEARYTTGVSWYLSAMLLAMAILHPLFKKDPKRAAYTLCPPLSLLLYGFLNMSCGHIALSAQWILEIFNAGILRAMAGISLGFLLGALIERANDWEPTKTTKILFSVLEALGIVGLIAIITNESYAYTSYDLVWVAMLFGILWIALSGKAWHTPLISTAKSKIFSEISLLLFFNHFPWCTYFKNKYSTTEEAFRLLPWAVLCIACSCAVVWGLTKLTRFVIKRYFSFAKEK